MNSKSTVLERIRNSLNNPESNTAVRQEEQQVLEKVNASLRPRLKSQNLLECLIERMESVQISVEIIQQHAMISEAVEHYLQRHDLPQGQIRISPDLNHLNWPATIQLKPGNADKTTEVSVTSCLAAVAETGSLIFESATEMPTSLLFLPEHHIVILEKNKIVAHMENVWDQLTNQHASPRVIHCNTGPSRTADIELTLELGAHGPGAMHVIIVGTA